MKKPYKIIYIGIFSILLSACSTTPSKPVSPDESRILYGYGHKTNRLHFVLVMLDSFPNLMSLSSRDLKPGKHTLDGSISRNGKRVCSAKRTFDLKAGVTYKVVPSVSQSRHWGSCSISLQRVD